MNVNDIIKIEKIGLGNEDYFSLSQLYLPLIGVTSYTIYIVLNNIKENEITIKKVLDLFGLTSAKTIEQALTKLEGIGLVKKYSNKQNSLLFSFLQPLSAKSFLGNTLLKDYLVGQIGEVEVNNVYSSLKMEKPRGYEDITLRFDEVFKSVKDKINRTKDFVIEEDNIKIKNSSFDYLLFKVSFDNEILSNEVLNDEDFENQILKISYQYELNEQEMKEAVIKAMTVNKDLKYEDIARNAGYIYQNKTNNKVLGFDVKEPEKFDHELTSEDELLITTANDSSISQMLAAVSGGKGSLVDVRDFTKLQETTNLPEGVINILIFYLTNLKQGENLSFTYIEKVARNWMKAGVRTTVDAIKFLKANKDKEKEVKPRSKKQVDEPEWMKRDSKIVEKELTDEEVKRAKELAKKLLG